jgi:hypothetical protein
MNAIFLFRAIPASTPHLVHTAYLHKFDPETSSFSHALVFEKKVSVGACSISVLFLKISLAESKRKQMIGVKFGGREAFTLLRNKTVQKQIASMHSPASPSLSEQSLYQHDIFQIIESKVLRKRMAP